MRKTIFSLFAILTLTALITGCAPAPSAPSGETPVRTINTSGAGVVELQPDMARVNIGVRSQSEDIQQALDDNIAKAGDIRDALLELGIEENDIQTRNFSVYPQQTPGPEPETSAQSFVVENTISVIVRDLDSLGDVLATVIDAGANTIHGVQFDISDRESAIEEARQKAIENARAQGKAIAEAAGVELGEIQTISLNDGGGPSPVRGEYAMEAPEAESVPISAGTMTVRVTANITFLIK